MESPDTLFRIYGFAVSGSSVFALAVVFTARVNYGIGERGGASDVYTVANIILAGILSFAGGWISLFGIPAKGIIAGFIIWCALAFFSKKMGKVAAKERARAKKIHKPEPKTADKQSQQQSKS